MSYATFKANVVGQAARTALAKLNVLVLNPGFSARTERLGMIVDFTVDINAQHGPDAHINLSIEDHALLHGHFPPPPP